jgi:hypothetical protein
MLWGVTLLRRRESLRQCFRRIRPDFRQRGMVVRQGREFVDGHPFRQRRDDFVDQLAADRPDARTAEDLYPSERPRLVFRAGL